MTTHDHDPGDEHTPAVTSIEPVGRKSEHEWIATGGSRWRVVFDQGAWIAQMFVRSHSCWQTFMVPAEVTSEIARLAGLVPPEDRDA